MGRLEDGEELRMHCPVLVYSYLVISDLTLLQVLLTSKTYSTHDVGTSNKPTEKPKIRNLNFLLIIIDHQPKCRRTQSFVKQIYKGRFRLRCRSNVYAADEKRGNSRCTFSMTVSWELLFNILLIMNKVDLIDHDNIYSINSWKIFSVQEGRQHNSFCCKDDV